EAPARAGSDETKVAEAGGRRLRVEARALIEKGERLLSKAGSEDAEDLVNGIEAVKDRLDGGEAELKAAMDALADLLYYLDA
ncbi:MAG: heat-shock protein Hsp70, partial [Candidatus Accumulibacter sp.]|nr:heat-shock protein Hsp70 [Accumulibacter sp.]